jgi:aerobic carbon-monoxide dehydrogenase medium subunit
MTVFLHPTLMARLLSPDTIEEACSLLREASGSALVVGGGTAVQMRRRRGALPCESLVDLKRIPGLDRIEVTEGGLRIGTLVTHRRIETDPVVQAVAPLLPQAYAQIANVRVRHAATVGGNLAYADHRLDPPGALLVLGASVEVASADGAREVPLADFFVGFETTALRDDEILVAIRVPRPPGGHRARFAKFKSLGRNDWPCVGVSAMRHDGRLDLGVTAVSPIPVHLSLDASGLSGAEAAERAEEAADAAIDPITDLRGGARFKRRVARVTVADTVRSLWEEVAA